MLCDHKPMRCARQAGLRQFADGFVLWQSDGDTYGEHRMFKHLTVILAFLMTLSSPVVAQDFQKGLAAARCW